MKVTRRLAYCSALFILLILVLLCASFLSHSRDVFPTWQYHEQQNQAKISLHVATVVASQATDDTKWLTASFPSWDHNIHPAGNYTKGHEAMVYLTYIINNYHLLPDIVVFLHAARYQWHNDDPLYDNARALSRLQLPYVQKQGYVNLRCAWRPGCPSEIRPHDASIGALSDKFGMRTGPFFAGAFRELLPDLAVPEDVGVGCCAQFAVSKQQILKRPLEDYERLRRWLAETELESSISGRIFEQKTAIVELTDSVTSNVTNLELAIRIPFRSLLHYQQVGPGTNGKESGRMSQTCDSNLEQ
ncbi:hypothetical protein E4T39_06855 [Aureobasidium subglaciale]|nr:hypothetical protein E4T39_06855 [Aureobasidium subglaciale]